MNKSDESKIFEKYLESIGGLSSGYNINKPPIMDRRFFLVLDGWLPLIQEIIEKSIELGWNKEICQVKEKFGGLRFYINDAPKDVFELISEYENKSYDICEKCGEKGELRKNGWWKTLCDEHNDLIN